MNKNLILFLTVVSVVGMTACGKHHQEEISAKHHPANAIILSQNKAKAAGVKTAVAKPGPFNDVIAVSGRVLSASNDETTVSATVSGIVRLLRPLSEGQQVGAGLPVFVISSKGLEQGDAVQKARIRV